MFKVKGATFGIAVAVVTAGLLVAGMSFAGTTGAATDDFGNINGAPTDLTIPSDTGTDSGNPPASPIEPGTPVDGGQDPISGNPVPGDPNSGDAGAGGLEPGQLPSAGFGSDGGANGASTLIVLLAIGGAALAGAGATAVASKRN